MRSNSATSASLPGGLEVLTRTRSCSSVTTSLFWARAASAPPASDDDGDRECCEPATTMHDASLESLTSTALPGREGKITSGDAPRTIT